ncbi:BYPASS-related protein [Artemisia annua]|uniref:BYPASS-related protein n=1 Tax=Artemisia annua TaxID=35608 RepID=A0A2U1ME17_ARTAN|nr:BYPASS-related protein [Artemisia annua]
MEETIGANKTHIGPGNGAKYRVGPQGWYTKIEKRPPYEDRKISLEEMVDKHIEESSRKNAKFQEWMNEMKVDTERNLRNLSAAIKNLKTLIGQLEKNIRIKTHRAELEECKVLSLNEENEETKRNAGNEGESDVPEKVYSTETGNCSKEITPEKDSQQFKINCIDPKSKLKGRDYSVDEWITKRFGSANIEKETRLKAFVEWMIDSYSDESVKSKEYDDPLERSFERFKLEIEREVLQLLDEYELKIGIKGYVLQDIWEKCKRTFKKGRKFWHEVELEEMEVHKCQLEGRRYDPPEIKVETFEVRTYTLDGVGSFISIDKPIDKLLPIGRRNGEKFKDLEFQKLLENKIVKNGRDLVARAFHALGLLTVVIGNVLVSVLLGDSERVKIKVNDNKVLDVDDVAKQLVIMRDVIDDAEGRVRLVESVKDMEMKVKRFSDGVDALNSGVNGLYRTMLKTRNGCLDAKC